MILIASAMGWQLTPYPWLGGPDVRRQLRASAAFAALLRRVRDPHSMDPNEQEEPRA